MNESNVRHIKLEHSAAGYKLEITSDELPGAPDLTIRRINSYISSITEFANSGTYLKHNYSSFFYCDGYYVEMRAVPGIDSSRNVLLTELDIIDLQSTQYPDFSKLRAASPSTNDDREFSDPEFDAAFKAFVFSTAVSGDTVMYCLFENDSDYDKVKNILFGFDIQIVKRNNLIEAVSKIPEVEASIVMCRCILPEDKANFIKEIKTQPNYVLADLTAAAPSLEANIRTPNYAQHVANILFNNKNKPKVSAVNNLYIETKSIVSHPKFFKAPKRAVMNLFTYEMLSKHFPECLSKISISDAEKKELLVLLSET